MTQLIQPTSRHQPSGYTHGILLEPDSRLLFISGQLASNSSGAIEHKGLVEQFLLCIDNVMHVVNDVDPNASTKNIIKMTIFITDFDCYRKYKALIAVGWNARFGDYYPTISIVEVGQLIDKDAKVEIEAIATIGDQNK
ncbi:RidA family protein [Teredinibacter waterburyi]|uniref:RidA family protein n=1 Tax=Teredinibacter waterburyi TaxID=1500538 RepID=UPI00165F4BA2|nr:RidA family protein [Teredinibacter waterburyi]